jgi:hypothetical protein
MLSMRKKQRSPFRMEVIGLRLRGIKPIRTALLIIYTTILLISPAVRAGESPLRTLLTQAAIAKPFGGDSLRVAANLLGTEAFDTAAEVMPDLVELLDSPIATATGGADFADGIVRRLGLGDMPGQLAKRHRRTGTVLKPADLDSILTGYSRRTDILVARLPNEHTCCDTAAFIEDIRGSSAFPVHMAAPAPMGVPLLYEGR